MGPLQQHRVVPRASQRVASKIRTVLLQLAESYDYASDAGRDRWDFATEIGSLSGSGLTIADFRYLACKGYVEHAREITLPGDPGRTFRPEGELTFGEQTCFVLTEAGLAVARAARREKSVARRRRASDGNGRASVVLPHFDPKLRELRVGDQLVKHFKSPAPNQQVILSAFEEEGWPPRIDDPLPPHPDQDSKRRLNDTIKSLNRHQKSRLIHFEGDGTGEGVRWGLLP